MVNVQHCASSNWALLPALSLLLLAACCCCSLAPIACTLGCDDSLGGLGAYSICLGAYWCCSLGLRADLHVIVEDEALVAAVFCTAHRTLGPRHT